MNEEPKGISFQILPPQFACGGFDKMMNEISRRCDGELLLCGKRLLTERDLC